MMDDFDMFEDQETELNDLELFNQCLLTRCNWNQCNALLSTDNSYESYKAFEDHVVSHGFGVERRFQHENLECYTFHCNWLGCELSVTLNKNEESQTFVTKHLSEHAIHSRLIAIGENYTLHNLIPNCILHKKYLPTFPIKYQCRWIGCKWASENCSSPVLYYSHVTDHSEWVADKIEMGQIKYYCLWDGCNEFYRFKSRLREHLRYHTGEKKIACPSCWLCFSASPLFRNHVYRQARQESGDYLCQTCNKRYSDFRYYRDHIYSHSRPFKCEYCDFTCGSKSNLSGHCRYKHCDLRNHRCEICQKTFKTSNDLSRHVLAHNKNKNCEIPNKIYVCHICNKEYSRGHYLSRHFAAEHEISSGGSRLIYEQSKVDGKFYLREKLRE